MRKARRFAPSAVLIVGAILLIVPAGASAFTSNYNCTAKPSGQWCDGRANGSFDGLHSWDYNQAYNPGTWNGLTVCQQVYKPSSGNSLSGSSCGNDYSDNIYGNVLCICYEAEVRHFSGGTHNIAGYADAAW